jgi:tRNA threonylcarbamoyladenosine biosynthesis protein TsaB
LPPEALILGFDTSAAHCAAALLSGDRVIVSRVEPMEKGQAERLMPMLEEVLAEGGVGWRDLDALAVCTGPGNFTGVRIAVAAARGLALGLGVPAVGVTVFEARAAGLPLPLTVIEDARRGEVYVQRFPGGTAQVVPAAAVGDGPAVGRDLAPRWPVAEAVARVAAGRLTAPQPRPAPFYLREADAALPSEPPPVILP